jgi:hypothetical protein
MQCATRPECSRFREAAAINSNSATNVGRTRGENLQIFRVGSQVGTNNDRAAVVIDTLVEDALVPLRLTVGDATVQPASLGAPAQVTDTVWFSPPSGITFKSNVVDCPAAIVDPLGDTTSEKSMPVPVSDTVCGVPLALSATDSTPVLLPLALGLNVTLIVQCAPTPTLAPQLFDSLKSPLAAILVMPRGALPEFVKVTACAPPLAPTNWPP